MLYAKKLNVDTQIPRQAPNILPVPPCYANKGDVAMFEDKECTKLVCVFSKDAINLPALTRRTRKVTVNCVSHEITWVPNPKYTHIAVYRSCTYDLVSDVGGGKSVNNVYDAGAVKIKCTLADSKPDITDYQLSRFSGFGGGEWEGESDRTLYCRSKRNGDPKGELRFERLYPIGD